MASGGARPGAGRKPSGPDAVSVNWRVSESAKKWMKERAVESGVSIAAVLDSLISFYDAAEVASTSEY